MMFFFFFQAEDGIRDLTVTGVQTCALPISRAYVGLVARTRAPSTSQIAWTRVVFPVPSSPESPMTAGPARSRPSASPNRWSASADRRITAGVGLGPELEDLVAQQSGELEVELFGGGLHRSEEHTSELQSQSNLVCRLLLEKKKQYYRHVISEPEDAEKAHTHDER